VNNNNAWWWVIGAVVVAAGVALWWYFGQYVPSQQTDEPAKHAEEVEVTVVATDFKFTPNEFSVKKGEDIHLTFKNDGNMPHTFVIDGVVDSGLVAPGESKLVEFDAPATAGEYQYYCSVIGHKESGMTGTLNVE